MFTEAEWLRAIELYFKYDRKLAPVVRELGYPSRRWIRMWEASDGATETIRRKPRYSDVQKQAAVEHYLNHGCCLAFTSRTLGYPCSDVLTHCAFMALIWYFFSTFMVHFWCCSGSTESMKKLGAVTECIACRG